MPRWRNPTGYFVFQQGPEQISRGRKAENTMFFFAPLFAMPFYTLMILYVLAAVLPAIFLMRYVYRQDHIEKEPRYLLASLVLRGVAAALAAIVLEILAKALLDAWVAPTNPKYTILLAFLGVAAVEEGTKFFFLYRRTWRDPNFNFRYDAILYAVFVSLGFAAFENVKYIFNFGLSIALSRAILAVPGHMGFAVFMGIFYGRAKLRFDCGDRNGCRGNLVLSYLAPVLLHGVYDSCCMSGTTQSTLIFILFVIVMYISVFALIKHESRTDTPV